MLRIVGFGLVAFLAGYLVAVAHAEATPADRLARSSGHLEVCMDQALMVVETMEKSDKKGTWARVRRHLKSDKGKRFMAAAIRDVYVKHLDAKDLETIQKFYATAAGARWGKRHPTMVEEIRSVGSKMIGDALVGNVLDR